MEILNYISITVGAVLVLFTSYQLITYYKKDGSDMNRFAAKREQGAAAARTGFKEALTKETIAESELKETPERQERLVQKERVEHENTVAVGDAATNSKMNPTDFSATRMVQESNKSMLELEAGKSKIALVSAGMMASIEVKKDYDIRMNQLQAMLALKQFPFKQLAEARKEIFNLLIEKAVVEESKELPAFVRVEYSALLQNTVNVYLRQYGQQLGSGFLQDINGQDVGAIDGFTELGLSLKDLNQDPDDEV